MTNSKIGSTYEELAAQILNKHGYWAYVTQKKVDGQPVDVIAAKKKDNSDIVYLLDVKHVRESVPSFTLSRIEPNQFSSLEFCHVFAHLDRLGFAIYFERTENWYWLPFEKAYDAYKNNVKSIHLNLLEKFEDILE